MDKILLITVGIIVAAMSYYPFDFIRYCLNKRDRIREYIIGSVLILLGIISILIGVFKN